VERLLDQLCTDLGFCLYPNDYRLLQMKLPLTIDKFIDEILLAEGFDVHIDLQLRKQVRDRVENWFNTEVTNNDD
jgi:hypothetical protein